jgi:ribose transport system ATP-binding protein
MSDNVLSLDRITKAYPGVVALKDVSLGFQQGEVHALLGENGAGKSTLIKIIAGAERPNSGVITVDGVAYDKLTPHLSRSLGIEVIYQEFNLVDSLSAAENIALGERSGLLVDFKSMYRRAAELFESFEVDIHPATLVRDLPSSLQQIVEIAKAVSKNARILIMDEPTAPLTVTEVDTLFKIIRTAKSRGVTVIYISHRLDELFAISDRVTVLRDGLYIDTLETARTNRQEMISLMVGRELSESYPDHPGFSDDVVLELRNLTGNGDTDISLSLHRGEILGLAGLVGAGRTELAKVIYGAAHKESGTVLIEGREVDIRSPRHAIQNGIGLIPENRKEEGCFLEMGVKWNITLAAIRTLSRGILVDRKREEGESRRYASLLKIKTPSLKQRLKNLSGGNQQKVVLARTLATQSRILIFDEPTRGIDVGTRHEIYRLMCSLAEEGQSILMITSDMEELLGMSDRIAVLCEGSLSGIIEKSDFSQQLVLELASGITKEYQ